MEVELSKIKESSPRVSGGDPKLILYNGLN